MAITDINEQGRAGEAEVVKKMARWRETSGIIIILFKVRVVVLLLLAATGGAFLATGGWPGWGKLLPLWLAGGMAASGASSFNQYLERKSDGAMGRTKKRPLVNGDIPNPGWIPFVSIALILVPSLAVLPFNPPLTFFLLLGAFIYVVIYTILLKPRTLLNVVIGGAAGSAAVLSGSAAVGYWNEPGALLLSLILFLWSPFHFWSLALLYRDDYTRADVPMLPTKTSPRSAAWWVLLHTLPCGLAGLSLVLMPSVGWLYFVPMLGVTAVLFWRNVQLIQDPSPPNARRLFMASNIYLTTLLMFMFVDVALPFLKGI